MRFRFRAAFVASSALCAAIACVGGPDRCLNPQPDLPSCHSASPGVPPASGGTSASASAGAGPVTGVPSVGGFGAGLNVGSDDAGLPGDQVAGSSGDFAGAGARRRSKPLAVATVEPARVRAEPLPE